MQYGRKFLSAPELLNTVRNYFATLDYKKNETLTTIQLEDHLMSALAIFSLKYPSLLKFDTDCKEDKRVRHNLNKLYKIKNAPSDTYLREILDQIDPADIRKVFKKIFANVQRGKLLESYKFLDNYYLLPLDGTGFFSSNKIHCKQCCEKIHNRCKLKILYNERVTTDHNDKNTYYLEFDDNQYGLSYNDNSREYFPVEINDIPDLKELLSNIKLKPKHNKEAKEKILSVIEKYHYSKYGKEATYYHNMLCGAIVHPDIKTVLPFAPEPILNTDGSKKNDCEHNATKRFIANFKREHPHLKVIVVQDSIASNYPNLSNLRNSNMEFITGVKPGDHAYLFETIKNSDCETYEYIDNDKTEHKYRFLNNVSLNKSHPEFRVNFIEYSSKNIKGKVIKFSWVTSINIDKGNCIDIMKGGRSNWRVENNTINTLKNQGYQFEHNFGHGYNNLSTVFGMLMVLAFFIDQIQEQSCELWKAAKDKKRTRSGLFEMIKAMFQSLFVYSWFDIYHGIAYGYSAVLEPDTG